MGASLSGVFNLQEFTDLGLLGAGMRLYTYVPATTNQKIAYTDAAGTIPQTYTNDGLGGQYIALNSRGELPAPLFLLLGGYDITLKTSAGVTVWTRRAYGTSDEISAYEASLAGINGATLVGTTLTDGTTPTTVDGALDELRGEIATQSQTLADITAGFNDQDALQQFATDVGAGTLAIASVFGDSTMWGADPANLANQVAVPPPSELQNFVNLFNQNAALTITNNAVSGTTCTQMIAGTDGSGSTFAAKMAASAARVVFCNHGINDAFGANATSAAAYRAALLSFVKIVRSNGKTPVLITPHPALTIGTFGSQARAEATGRFAQIMRDVATQHAVKLVDNFRYFSLMLGNDANMPLATFPDGVHAAALIYTVAGNNMADAILGGQVGTISKAGQRMPASGPSVRASGQQINPTTSSRVGVVTTSGTVTPQTLRVLFRVDQPGLDVSLMHPVFSSGSDAIVVALDGIAIGAFAQWSQLVAGFGASFWQDFETTLIRNCNPGFHILTFTTTSTGGIGIHALRARDAEKPLTLPNGSADPSLRKLLSPRIDMTAGTANTITVYDDMPASRFLSDLELEWTGQMLINSALVIGGNVGPNAGTAVASQALFFGLDAAGKLAVWETTAPATFTLTTIGAVDLSLASHIFRVKVTAARFGVVTLWVDETQIGTVNLTLPYYGGLVGLWKNIAGSRLTITNLSRIWRL